MAVYDQWHKAPGPGDQPCGCGTKRSPLYPSARHKAGDRWQVRWRDPASGKQRKRNFAKRVGVSPGEHADAFDAQVQREIDSGGYRDPALAKGTFGAYALQWLALQTHDAETARTVRARLWWHALEDPANPGRTRRGGPALGHLTWAQLGRYPSLTQAWLAGLTCAASTQVRVATVASSVFGAATGDGLIGGNPLEARSVTRPRAEPRRAVPWGAAKIAAVMREMPPRYRVAMLAGPSTGARKGEVLALADTDVAFLAPSGQRTVTVAVQLKRAGGALCFAPLKNRRAHVVPVPDELTEELAAHLRQFPALEVTLPWHDERDPRRHGRPVTRRLVIHDGRGPVGHKAWDRRVWKPALQAAGIITARKQAAPEEGTHAAWRHTFVSEQLARGAEVTAVAEWIGDTVATVTRTYAHMLPGAAPRGRAATAGLLAEVVAASCAPDVPREAARRGKPQATGGGG